MRKLDLETDSTVAWKASQKPTAKSYAHLMMRIVRHGLRLGPSLLEA